MPKNSNSPFACPDEPPFIRPAVLPPQPKIEFSVVAAAPNRGILFDWISDQINYYRNPDRDPNDPPKIDAEFKPGDVPVKFSATFKGTASELAEWLIGVSNCISNSLGGAFRQNRLGDAWTYQECKVLPEWPGSGRGVRLYSYWTETLCVASKELLVQTLRAIAADALAAFHCPDDATDRRKKIAFKSKLSERIPNEGPINFYGYFETSNAGELSEKMRQIAVAIEHGEQKAGRFAVGGWCISDAIAEAAP